MSADVGGEATGFLPSVDFKTALSQPCVPTMLNPGALAPIEIEHVRIVAGEQVARLAATGHLTQAECDALLACDDDNRLAPSDIADIVRSARKRDALRRRPARLERLITEITRLVFLLGAFFLGAAVGLDRIIGQPKPAAVTQPAQVRTVEVPGQVREVPGPERIVVRTVEVPAPARPASDYRQHFIRDTEDVQIGVGGPIEVRMEEGKAIIYLRLSRNDGEANSDIRIRSGAAPVNHEQPR